MTKNTILTLAFACASAIGTSAYAGQGTVIAIYVDTNCGGFVQFSDAPGTWVGVPQAATTSLLPASIASALVWQTLNTALALNFPVTYHLSGTYCGDQHPALLELFTGNPQ